MKENEAVFKDVKCCPRKERESILRVSGEHPK